MYKEKHIVLPVGKRIGDYSENSMVYGTKIRLMLGNRQYKDMLGGIVEVDEVYMVRDTSKKTKQGRGTNKSKVFGMRERASEFKESGEIRLKLVRKTDSNHLHPVIFDNVEIGSWLMSDEYKAYYNLEDFYVRGVLITINAIMQMVKYM